MKDYLFTFILLWGVLLPRESQAQAFSNLYVAGMAETTSFPFTRYLPFHPGLEVGTTLWHTDRGPFTHRANAFLGGYHHRLHENGIYLRGEYQLTYPIQDLVGIDLPVGFGYQHTFYPGETYSQDPETGEWSEARQFGKPHALVNFGLGVTFLKTERVQPFIRQESTIDLPLFNSFALIRNFVKLGVNIQLN